MGFTVTEQTLVFLGSIGVGALLGLFYDLFRISRLALPIPALGIALEDLLFFSLCAISTFSYMLTTLEGQVRFFILLGEGMGGMVYALTLSPLVMGVAQRVIWVIKKILQLCWWLVGRPIVGLLRLFGRIFRKISEKFGNFFKKSTIRAKFRLKQHHILLYNLYKKASAPTGAGENQDFAREKIHPGIFRRWKRRHEQAKIPQSKKA